MVYYQNAYKVFINGCKKRARRIKSAVTCQTVLFSRPCLVFLLLFVFLITNDKLILSILFSKCYRVFYYENIHIKFLYCC